MKKEDLDYIEFRNKYKKRLTKELGNSPEESRKVTTRDYEIFKKSFIPKNLNIYEKACNICQKILPINPDKKSIPEIQEAIRTSHLNITPTGAMSFAAVTTIMIIALGTFVGYVIPFILTGGRSADNLFFVGFSIILALALFIPLSKLPFMISNVWRMKASNQMVLSIFYIVTYMRHTPNLELAIDFAAEHLAPPLSLDFKKVIWDIETGKFDNVSESLDYYLGSWRKYNPEFIESMHLIQGSLYESSEDRRQNALDKSLQVILDETYEKMLHYAHDLKTPITTLHMLGIVLPILGLVILPLLTAFVPEAKWYHLFALYNIALPIMVYYIGRNVLSNRPTGYGGIDVASLEADIDENNKISVRYSKKNLSTVTPLTLAMFTFIALFLIGLIPLAAHALNPDLEFVVTSQGVGFPEDFDSEVVTYAKFLDYRDEVIGGERTGQRVGPYGLGAALFSLLIPLSVGLGLYIYYKMKSKNLAKIREETRKLEREFASALFQLGNRLGDGVPAEIAFSNVAKLTEGTNSGKFFDIVTINIMKLGMGIEEAIFDKEVGALKYFPSTIIESSMKVFIESSKKGPLVASQALITVAEYIRSMHRVDERLKDLLADIVSSMKSQIAFLTPIIAGIVVGITSMISQILGALSERLGEFEMQDIGAGGGAAIMQSFGVGGVPTYHFQAIVGLYVVQITFILSILISGIESGADKIKEREELKNNLWKSTILYLVVAGIFMIMFNVIAAGIVSGIRT